MLKRALIVLAAVPAAVILLAVAVSNRQSVDLVLDPFKPEQPALSLAMPLYLLLFGTLLAGILLGGAACAHRLILEGHHQPRPAQNADLPPVRPRRWIGNHKVAPPFDHRRFYVVIFEDSHRFVAGITLGNPA